MTDEEQRQKALTKNPLTKNPLGPSGKAVAVNVKRLIDDQHLTFAALSSTLTKMGRPIPPLGLRKIVAETRRVDADDLVALAAALGVSPATLLMPSGVDAQDTVTVAGIELTAAGLWDWLRTHQPLPDESVPYDRALLRFYDRALPPWESIVIDAGTLGEGEPPEDLKRTLFRNFCYPDGVPDGDD